MWLLIGISPAQKQSRVIGVVEGYNAVDAAQMIGGTIHDLPSDAWFMWGRQYFEEQARCYLFCKTRATKHTAAATQRMVPRNLPPNHLCIDNDQFSMFLLGEIPEVRRFFHFIPSTPKIVHIHSLSPEREQNGC